MVSVLARELPMYVCREEPYYAMVAHGDLSAGASSFQDFEQLVEYSVMELVEPLPRDILFDRCPIDYLAYLANLSQPEDLVLRRWISDVNKALSRLDLLVYVPIERPDRVHIHAEEGRKLRRRVDETLREILVEDSWGFGAPVIEVHGSPERRGKQVLTHIRATT